MANAADVIGYGFDGALYCTAHVPKPNECGCQCGKVDENGACESNCHGYGPNPVFGDQGEPGDVCDACGAELA